MNKLKPIILRRSNPTESEISQVPKNPVYLILDRVIDTYNIGSLFRLADAMSVEKMFLCGDMEFPPSSRIHKAAVGTENWVPWEKKDSALETVKELKAKGVQIIAAEQAPTSVDYRKITEEKINFPCALICGNETDGVSTEVLKECDLVIEFPLYGINHSFNVWGSTAIVAYKILEFLK